VLRRLTATVSSRRLPSNPVLLWCFLGGFLGGNYYLSAQSSFPAWTSAIPFRDNVFHIVEFGMLAILLCAALRRTMTEASSLVVVALTLVGAGAWAFLDEYHQLSVPGRRGCLSECLIDVFGAITGAALWMGIIRLRRLRRFSAN
jgi:VanZ family protein